MFVIITYTIVGGEGRRNCTSSLIFWKGVDILTEAQYQAKLKKKLKERIPDSFIFKMDPTTIGCQGFPDLIVLRKDKWAALEVKEDEESSHQPNQDYYVNKIKEMGNYSSFIFPQNEEEVINELERALSD